MMERLNPYFEYMQSAFVLGFTALAAYMNSTLTFMIALMLAFTFNILAGLRADAVKVRLQRIWPPVFFQNWNGNKFKDSLFELLLIVTLIYLLKVIAELMKIEIHISGGGVYVVQYLTWIALYYYLRNGLRNMTIAYPKNKFIKIVYIVLAFKFKEFLGNELKEEIDKIENEDTK